MGLVYHKTYFSFSEQVIHSDGSAIVEGMFWIEPHGISDVLLYDQSLLQKAASKDVKVTLDPAANKWKLTGIANASDYTTIFQVLSPFSIRLL